MLLTTPTSRVEIVPQQSTTSTKKPDGIHCLSRDILLLIFELMRESHDVSTATCLGLTSRSFYSILKLFYPQPIEMDETNLNTLVASFIGSQYRPAYFMVPRRAMTPFLSRDVYGLGYGSKEKKLRERWADYRIMCSIDQDTGEEVYLLPSPYQMGDMWYKEAMSIYEQLKKEGMERHPKLQLEWRIMYLGWWFELEDTDR